MISKSGNNNAKKEFITWLIALIILSICTIINVILLDVYSKIMSNLVLGISSILTIICFIYILPVADVLIHKYKIYKKSKRE